MKLHMVALFSNKWVYVSKCVRVWVCVCVQPQLCRGFVLLVTAKTLLVATFPSFSPSLPL